MRRYQLLISLLAVLLLLTACGADEQQPAETDPPLLPILADLKVPETAEVGQEVELAVKVTHGDEVVTDAEVEFEIIEENSGHKEMIPGVLNDEHYTAIFKIEGPGSYTVISHVDARSMHTMPEKIIEVEGNIEDTASAAEREDSHHHHAAVIDFNDGQADAGEEILLTTAVTFEEEPLSEARVRFEIWKDGSERHEWIESAEQAEGLYEAPYTFEEAGKYFVQVHVEKRPDIHDHVTKEYEVK